MDEYGPNMSQEMNEFGKPISLLNVFNVLFRRKGVILTFFLLAVVVGSILIFVIPPVYQSSAQLLLERDPDSEKAILFRMNLPNGQARYDWVGTEIDIMKSRPVVVRVVRKLSLGQPDEGGELLTDAERSRRFEKTVESFKNTFTVNRDQNSNVIEIGFEADDPVLAANVVGEVIDTYLSHRSEIYDESETYRFFEEQMNIADEKLRNLEDQEVKYKEEREVFSPEGQTEILLTRLAEYEKSQTASQSIRIGKETKLAAIKTQRRNGGDLRIPSFDSNDGTGRIEYISKLKGDLFDMEIERERLLQNFTPQYKEVLDLDKTIEITREKINEEVNGLIEMEEAAIQAMQAKEDMLQSMIDETKKEMQEMARDEHELARIGRGIDINKEVYSMFLKQREEARISLSKLESGIKIKVISEPFVAPDPAKPEKAKIMLLSVFFGLFGGLGLAYVFNYFDHSITTPRELEDLTGLYVLGSIREIDLDGSDGQITRKETALSK